MSGGSRTGGRGGGGRNQGKNRRGMSGGGERTVAGLLASAGVQEDILQPPVCHRVVVTDRGCPLAGTSHSSTNAAKPDFSVPI